MYFIGGDSRRCLSLPCKAGVVKISLDISFDHRSAQIFQYYGVISAAPISRLRCGLISIELTFFSGMLSSIATLITYETNSVFSNSLAGSLFWHGVCHCAPNRIGALFWG